MTTPRPLAPLPRSARALLAAYRDAHEIPAAARDRIWSVVGSEDAPAPAYDPPEDEGRAARSNDAALPQRRASGRGRWLVWGAATLAAAAVLLLAWQLGGTLAERRHATRTPDAAVMQGGGGSPQGRASAGARARSEALPAELPAAHAVASDSTTVPGTPNATPDPSPAAAASRSTSSGGTSSSKAEPSRSQPGSDPAKPTTPAPGSTLAAERELVARAWRALALGETATALDAAAEHARRFPAGLLAPERAAIDTIARCRRGDADGPRRATTFHRAHPGSPLAERVDEACVASPKE